MTQSITAQIQQYEARLKKAMLQSDLEALDKLLAADLVFTNHLGHLMSKDDDMGAHQSGVLKIDKIDLSDQQIKILQDTAIVTVQAHIVGTFAGESSSGDFRFTRVWARTSNDRWQLVVAHSSIVT